MLALWCFLTSSTKANVRVWFVIVEIIYSYIYYVECEHTSYFKRTHARVTGTVYIVETSRETSSAVRTVTCTNSRYWSMVSGSAAAETDNSIKSLRCQHWTSWPSFLDTDARNGKVWKKRSKSYSINSQFECPNEIVMTRYVTLTHAIKLWWYIQDWVVIANAIIL